MYFSAPDFQQFIKKREHIHKRCFLWDGMDHHANWCVRSRGDGQAGHWWPEREVLLSLTFRPQAHQTDQYVKELSLKNKSSMYYIILHFKGGQCGLKDCERGCILVQLTSLILVKALNSRGSLPWKPIHVRQCPVWPLPRASVNNGLWKSARICKICVLTIRGQNPTILEYGPTVMQNWRSMQRLSGVVAHLGRGTKPAGSHNVRPTGRTLVTTYLSPPTTRDFVRTIVNLSPDPQIIHYDNKCPIRTRNMKTMKHLQGFWWHSILVVLWVVERPLHSPCGSKITVTKEVVVSLRNSFWSPLHVWTLLNLIEHLR